MPIEDVDYLKQNSVKQSYIFLVDSTDRDRSAYPTPSEYTITFSTPFHNVVGFEVLDALIPRTMYNIDGGDAKYPTNNTISFYIHDGTSDVMSSNVYPKSYATAIVEPGDYNIQTLISSINTNPSSMLSMHVNNDSNNPVAQIKVESVSSPPEVKNVLRFKCPYPFVMDMHRSTMAESLGFDLYTSRSEASKLQTIRRYESLTVPVLPPAQSNLQLPPNYKLYHSVDKPPEVGLGDVNTVYSGPRGIVKRLPLSSTALVAQSFVVPTKGYLTGVSAALGTSSGNVEGTALWELWTSSNSMPHTQFTLRNTTGLLDTDYVDGGLTVTTPSSNSSIPGYATLNPGTYWVVFKSATTSPGMFIYYNDVPQSQGSSINQSMLICSNGNVSPASDRIYGNDMNNPSQGLEFIASAEITVQSEYHEIEAPGLLSLVGERFTILRCKEIEENSYRSLAYTTHCMGLAKFRLGVVGYSENRVDFSKVPLREFHPIGKLSKLSLRFETASGLLYDFKGVNHTLTFAIHYLEPTQKNTFTKSLLNPQYTGEFMKDIHYGEHEEESDDQEYDYNSAEPTNQIEMYRLRENRHLPSTVQQMDLEAMHRFALGEDQDVQYEEEDEDDQYDDA